MTYQGQGEAVATVLRWQPLPNESPSQLWEQLAFFYQTTSNNSLTEGIHFETTGLPINWEFFYLKEDMQFNHQA